MRICKKISSIMCVSLVLLFMVTLSMPVRVLGATSISNIDTSLSTYDRTVMNVNGKPFFFNGIQLRDDWLRSHLKYTDAQIKNLYQLAADDGFTAVNSQLMWSDVQPDQVYNASETTYISGGSNAETNYTTCSSVKVKYDSDNESNQALSYLKFDFSDIAGTTCAAAKIRILVNNIDSGTCNLHLYGITDDSWDASKMTWNSGSPNHSGYDISGTLGKDYYDLGVTPSYDPVNKVAAYDFDVTDFINNHCYGDGKEASFILRADTTNNIGVTIDGANGTTLTPKLVISRDDVVDYSYLDKLIGWAESANIKMDLLWFGSDLCKVTADDCVPYYVIRNYQKVMPASGKPLITKGTDITASNINRTVYEFLMCKNDANLRTKEYAELKGVFDHIATYNSTHGDKKTVIGCDVDNEPGGIKVNGGYCQCDNCKNLYSSGGYSSWNTFEKDTFWKSSQNLGKAVKDSNYPVWTRMNFHTSEFSYVYRNEETKASGATSYIDFVGYDPYVHTTDLAYEYGNGLGNEDNWEYYNYGANYPMIMENGALNSNSDYLDIATISGGAIYNLYDLLCGGNFSMYKSGTGNVPVAANKNTTGIISTNKWLNTLWYDLATKQPDGAGGTKLVFFNEHGDTTADVTKKIRSLDVNYSTTNAGVGIAVERDDHSIALGSKTNSTFTLKNLLSYGTVTATTGYYDSNNLWVSTGSKNFTTNGNDVLINMNAYETVKVMTTNSIPERTINYSLNDNFNSQTVGTAPSGWTNDTSQGTVTIASKPGTLDNSVSIIRKSTSTGNTMSEKSFTALSGTVTVEAKVRTDQTSAYFGAPYVYDSDGNNAFGVAFDAAGNIVYKDSSDNSVTLQSYTKNTWYEIKLVINTDTDTCDLYINDEKELSQVSLKTSVSNISKVRFFANNSTKGSMNFDNIKVYQ